MSKPRLIGISGGTASGKSTVAQGLIEHFGAETNRFSKILATIATDLSLQTDKASLQRLSTALRTHLGEGVLVRAMGEWVKTCPSDTIVVEGMRRLVDIEILAAAAQDSGREWVFFYIDVPYDERFRRHNERLLHEGKSSITSEEFSSLDTQECEIELPFLQAQAHKILTNTTSPDEALQNALSYIDSR